MLKVLLVENETLDRLHLKTLIDWGDYGYELVGEAQNGSEGLALIAALEPDIVITDIRMPVLNGLELMAACPPGPQRPEFLIMSGFDDYDLVRRGLTLGAYDYLRKFDVNPRSLLEALGGMRAKRLARTPEAEGAVAASAGPNVSTLTLLAPLLRGQPFDDTELVRSLSLVGTILLPHDVHCALVRMDPGSLEELVLPEQASTERSVLGIVDEVLRPAYHSLGVSLKPGLFLVLASPRDPDDAGFVPTLERLVDMLSLYLNLEARAGLGSSRNEPNGLHLAFQRAQLALRNRFFFEGQRLILWSQVPAGLGQEARTSLLTRKDDLKRALDTQKRELLTAFFERLQDDLGGLGWSASAVKEALIELNYLVREYFEGNQLDTARLLPRSRMTYEDITAMDDVGQARRWVRALSDDLAEFLAGEARVEYSRVILNVKKYVTDHLGEELTLAVVAQQACLSPNYFSSLFKRHAGMSFTEYLNSVRTAAAKRLLAETDLLIYEVAERCGYHDSYYFNRIFKRLTGTAPGSYRREAQGPSTGEKDKESGN